MATDQNRLNTDCMLLSAKISVNQRLNFSQIHEQLQRLLWAQINAKSLLNRSKNTGFDMTREDEIFMMLRDLFRSAHSRLAGHRVVLFGSRARGDAKPRSDFDIGVIGETPLPLEDYYALEDRLEDLPTLYRIDWVDLMRVGEKFRQEALSDIKVIYED